MLVFVDHNHVSSPAVEHAIAFLTSSWFHSCFCPVCSIDRRYLPCSLIFPVISRSPSSHYHTPPFIPVLSTDFAAISRTPRCLPPTRYPDFAVIVCAGLGLQCSHSNPLSPPGHYTECVQLRRSLHFLHVSCLSSSAFYFCEANGRSLCRSP